MVSLHLGLASPNCPQHEPHANLYSCGWWSFFVADFMEIALEPFPGQLRDLLQGARFFKQVGCAGNDFELLISAQFGHRLPIQFDHREVLTTDDEQNRDADSRERRPSKIRPTPTRYDHLHNV